MKYGWENNQEPDADGNYIAFIDLEDGNRPMRFIGKDVTEVAGKLMESQANASAEIKRRNDLDKANRRPDKAPVFATETAKPQPLTNEEKFQLRADMDDVDKMPDAIRRIVEATAGVPLSKVGEKVSGDDVKAYEEYCGREATAFVEAHPDYYVDPRNVATLFNYLEVNKMDLTRNNLAIAYDDLAPKGLLITGPTGEQLEEEETSGDERQEPQSSTPGAQSAPANTRPRTLQTASGLRAREASAPPPAPTRRPKITRAALNAMSQAEYAEKFRTDPEFRKAVDALPPE